ncbi:class I SAM-dependent methyltransferase [bacterium]|nr:class I SAM-dependent methyltransferase [bacterium]
MNCRSCGSNSLDPVISLGDMPLANGLLREIPASARPEPRYPLNVVFCEACSMVQITDIVSPPALFDEYVYFSSTSRTMLAHVEASANRLIGDLGLTDKSLVVEAASNDGYMLQYFVRRGIPSLGVEPAKNIAEEARRRGVPTEVAYFGQETALRLFREGRHADLFLANNVLAHVPDLNGFVQGIATILKEDGAAVIEAPHVGEMVRQTAFDTIYHEHIFYFSLTALERLLRRNGLVLSDAEALPIHGGSVRITVRKNGQASTRARTMLAGEQALGLDRISAYRAFSGAADKVRDSLKRLLGNLVKDGKRVAGYGAAAKAAVMMNACGIGRDLVQYVVDASSHKQGKFMPGTHQPIYAPERLQSDPPDYLVIFPWNIRDEIMRQESGFAARGGKFIVPIPEVTVV